MNQPAQEVQSAVQTAPAGAGHAVRALVLTGFGINCEEEVAAAYRLAGAEATIVHLNQVLHGEVSIHDFDVLNFPGGFSFGDDLGSGVVLANKLRYRQIGPAGAAGADAGPTLLDDIKAFVAAGKFVLGICNGFQVLVKLGLLPNLGGGFRPEVTLTHNASGRYENRWVRLQVNPNAKTPFLTGLATLEVPVRHGEGRLVLPDEATGAALQAAGLNCLSYVNAAGDGTSQYPLNPNGAALNCAGLCDTTGQIFGLMPHPEAFLAAENHPDWARRRRVLGSGGEGAGLAIFRNIVRHVAGLAVSSRSAGNPFASPSLGTPSPSPPLARGATSDGEGELVASSSSKIDSDSDSDSGLELDASPPSPSDVAPLARGGLGDGVPAEGQANGMTAAGDGATTAHEPRPHYARRQLPAADPTSIPDNVFTTSAKQWRKVKDLGRAMRQAPTPAEDALWQALRGQQLGVKFRRQHAIDSFIVDFVSLPDKLIIEVDGAGHGDAEQAAYDAGRTEILQELGYRVIRFASDAVFHQLPGVVEKINQNITLTAANA